MPVADRPDNQVGAWHLVEVLGTGAFGQTWRAQDPSGTPAAVKLLNGPPGDELRILARLAHPAIIEVLEAGGPPRPYLAMAFAPGCTLAEAVLSSEQSLRVVAALLDALAVMHAAGLTHGDVKPDNLMVDPSDDGTVGVKLIDFGLAGARRGGTPVWAAPERLGGGPATPAADVYAAGLVLWMLVHGELPFSELSPDEMLMRRGSTDPVPTLGEPWVKDLLQAMVAVDPARRPDAAAAADTFAAHGVPLPTIDAAWLRRRARTLDVSPPKGDDVVERWLSAGGTTILVGESGMGKTHLVERAALELSARGEPWVRIPSLGPAWSGISAALADPRLPGTPATLGPSRDPVDRAFGAVRQLLRRTDRTLYILVDDFASLDAGTRRAVEQLLGETEPCAVLVTSDRALVHPTRALRTERLSRWDRDGIARLVASLLGTDPDQIPSLVAHALRVSEGVPKVALEVAILAVERGAVRYAARRWTEHPDRLGDLPEPEPLGLQDLHDLSGDVGFVGAMAAAHAHPMPLDRLEALVDGPPRFVNQALHELVARGLVRVENGLVQATHAAAADALLALVPDPAALHARLAEALASLGPSARLGWHLVQALDPVTVAHLGPACIAAARGQDAEDAAALAEAAWRVSRTWDIAEQRILALVGAKQTEEAVLFGAHLDHADVPGLRPPVPRGTLIAMARALLATDQPSEALELIRRAQTGDAGAPRPIELDEVHVSALSKLGRVDVAVRVALAATHQPPDPTASAETVDAWLRTRSLAADGLQRLGEVEEATDILLDVPESLGAGRATRGVLEARRGRLLWLAKRYREAAQVFADAARPSSGLSALDRARLANNSALASFKVGDPAAAVAQWERARLIFDRLSAQRSRIGVQLNLCVGYLELGRWERARRAGIWALEHARAAGEHRYEAMAAGNLGDVHRQLEQVELARANYVAALTLAEEHAFAEEIAENLRRLGQLALELAEDGALASCQAAEERALELSIETEAGLAAALVAVGQARAGDREAATEALARSRGRLTDHGDARELAEWRLCSAMVFQSLGRSERAVAELARVVLFAEEVGSVQLRARADRVAQSIDGARLTTGPDREGMLLDMAVAVAQEQDLDSLLQAIADAALQLTDAERAFVLQRDERRVLASALVPGADLSPPSWTIAERAMGENREVIVADLGDRPDLRASTSVLTLDLRSVMCVPLVRAADVLGALYIDSGRAGEQELLELGRYLRALAGYAAIAMANAERVSQHDRQIEDASALAHDMRNLALVLIGLAEHVTEIDAERDETLEAMSDVQQVGNQLVQMTERFLQPSLRQSQVVSLSVVVGQLSSIVRHEADRRRIALVVDAPPGHHVRVDPEQMRRALFNIVHNAFKYCGDEGRVALAVSGSREQVYFTVHDSGPGIPDEIAPYIFDYRRQGRQARQGFGIGLAVASRAVNDAGGTIRAGNHPQGGGLVTIVLPRCEPVEA